MTAARPSFAAWWTRLRAALGVALASVIIWLFAEVQGLDDASIETQLSLAAAEQSSIRLRYAGEDPWAGSLQAQLRGSRGALSRVMSALASGLALTPEHPAIPSSPGVYSIDLAQALSQSAPLAETGVRVIAAQPARIDVRVIRLATREVEIALALPNVQTLGEPALAPARAKLTAPEHLLKAADDAGQSISVVASPSADAIEALAPGEPQTLTVRLRAPASLARDPDVAIEPSAAQLTIALRSQLESVAVAPTPIWVALPPTEINRWTGPFIAGDPFLGEVTVRGPRAIIERIRTGELGVLAVVSLSSDDLERSVQEKSVSFALLDAGVITPPPASLQFQTLRQRVELQFRKRETPAPAGAGATPSAPEDSPS